METVVKVECPICRGVRVCLVHGHFEHKWEHSSGENTIYGTSDYRILQCRGCETVFYQTDSTDTENIDFDYDQDGSEKIVYVKTTVTYPSENNTFPMPQWMWLALAKDPILFNILTQTYNCAGSNNYILATIGLRTALDRFTHLLEIDDNTFEDKLRSLLEQGYIGSTEHDVLSVVIDAGNAAAHRGWLPTEGDFRQLIAVFEHFLSRHLHDGKSTIQLKQKIPPRPPRKKQIKKPG